MARTFRFRNPSSTFHCQAAVLDKDSRFFRQCNHRAIYPMSHPAWCGVHFRNLTEAEKNV